MDSYDYPQYHWAPFKPLGINELEAIKSQTVRPRRDSSYWASSFYKWDSGGGREGLPQGHSDWWQTFHWYLFNFFSLASSTSQWGTLRQMCLIDANNPSSCRRSTRKKRQLSDSSMPFCQPSVLLYVKGWLCTPKPWMLDIASLIFHFSMLSSLIPYIFSS